MMIQKGKMNTFWKPAVLVVFLVAGFIAGRTGLVDWEWVFRQSERLAGNWWAPPAVIAAMSAFYLFGLPGSVFIWIAGLLYHPVPATLIITAGGVIGGTGAAVFARKMAGSPEDRPQADPALLSFMARHSDFVTLFAIRAMPFFPHAVINYGAGALGIHLGKFAVASAFGFAAKGFVYALAIHGATEADEIADLLDAAVFYPLLALVVLLVAGRALHRQWIARDGGGE